MFQVEDYDGASDFALSSLRDPQTLVRSNEVAGLSSPTMKHTRHEGLREHERLSLRGHLDASMRSRSFRHSSLTSWRQAKQHESPRDAEHSWDCSDDGSTDPDRPADGSISGRVSSTTAHKSTETSTPPDILLWGSGHPHVDKLVSPSAMTFRPASPAALGFQRTTTSVSESGLRSLLCASRSAFGCIRLEYWQFVPPL